MTPLPVLEPLLDTALAPFAHRLSLADDGERIDAPGSPGADRIPGTGLLEDAIMSDLMHRFRPDVCKTAPRAVFSFWTQHYFLRLLPPVLAANLIFERDLTLDLDRVTVVIDAEGLPARFLLRDTGTPLPAGTEGAARFARLEANHLTPLIASWSAQTRLSPRLFRGNLARYLKWVLTQLPELGAEAAAPALKAWLSESILAESARRRPCCLRDRLPGVAICEDCPKLERRRHV